MLHDAEESEPVGFQGRYNEYNMNEDAEIVSLFMEDAVMLRIDDPRSFDDGSFDHVQDYGRPMNPMSDSLPQLSMNERLRLRRKHDDLIAVDHHHHRATTTPEDGHGRMVACLVVSPKEIEYTGLTMDRQAMDVEINDHVAQSSRKKKRSSFFPEQNAVSRAVL
jgi:hypothetical protein